MTLTLDDIKRLRELGEKATKGPWESAHESNRGVEESENIWSFQGAFEPTERMNSLAWETDNGCEGYGLSKADADFCTTARNHWTAILDLAEKALEKQEEFNLELTFNKKLYAKFKALDEDLRRKYQALISDKMKLWRVAKDCGDHSESLMVTDVLQGPDGVLVIVK